MKATIEFELPKEQDAYLDAVNGTKWKELAGIADLVLTVQRDTEENRERWKLYDDFLKWFRSEREGEGLTLGTTATLQRSRSRQVKFWMKQLEDYLKKQGIPEMMAEMRKENRTHTTSKRKKSKIEKADEKSGVQGNSPVTEPE